MFAVAIAGVLLGAAAGLWRRHLSLKRRAVEYAERSRVEFMNGFMADRLRYPTESDLRARDAHYRLMDHYDGLKAKYERAARYPWLPVEPDPSPD